MGEDKLQTAMRMIGDETDANQRQLLLAALVSTLFREAGFEPVIVGGSAIEFYTDGAYMSGDVDVCWAEGREPTPLQRSQVMSKIPGAASTGTRTWKISGLFIDLLGGVTRHGDLPFNTIETPVGEVVLITVEELLVERVFSARCWTGYNVDEDACAKKLIASILRGELVCDWEAVGKIAESSAYRCKEAVADMRAEVEKAMG